MFQPAQELLLGFPRALREAGLAIDPARAENFLRAVSRVPLLGLADLARAGRITLTSSPAEFPAFDWVFQAWFAQDPALAVEPPGDDDEPTPKTRPQSERRTIPELLPGDGAGTDAAADEMIGRKMFARARPEDADILRVICSLTRPTATSRRWRHALRGTRIDIARTAAESRRTFGETIRLSRRTRPRQPRKLLLLIDISGSMKANSEAYLRAVHALSQGGSRIEVFCFSTRLTRITATLRHRDADEALRRLAGLVFDFDGGTRIGAALQTFLSVSRHAALVRGAVTVVMSDGLERGDIVPMVTSVERLARLSHRLVWLSPLASDPRYVPVARAMAGVLPSIDWLAPASTLATMQAALSQLAGLDRKPRRQAARAFRQARTPL